MYTLIKRFKYSVDEMAQLAKCLLYKHEVLSASPRTHAQKPGMVHAHNPSTGKADRLIPQLTCWSLTLIQKTRWMSPEKWQQCYLSHAHTHTESKDKVSCVHLSRIFPLQQTDLSWSLLYLICIYLFNSMPGKFSCHFTKITKKRRPPPLKERLNASKNASMITHLRKAEA